MASNNGFWDQVKGLWETAKKVVTGQYAQDQQRQYHDSVQSKTDYGRNVDNAKRVAKETGQDYNEVQKQVKRTADRDAKEIDTAKKNWADLTEKALKESKVGNSAVGDETVAENMAENTRLSKVNKNSTVNTASGDFDSNDRDYSAAESVVKDLYSRDLDDRTPEQKTQEASKANSGTMMDAYTRAWQKAEEQNKKDQATLEAFPTLQTIADLNRSFVGGMEGSINGLMKAPISLAQGANALFADENYQRNQNYLNGLAQELDDSSVQQALQENNSLNETALGRIASEVAQTSGGMVPQMISGTFFGEPGGALGLGLMGANVYGGTSQQALQGFYDDGEISKEEMLRAQLYGLANAAKEVGTEQMNDKFAFGARSVNDILQEGAEEAVGTLFDPWIEQILTAQNVPEAVKNAVVDNYLTGDYWKGMARDFGMGALTSAVSSAPSNIANASSIISEYNASTDARNDYRDYNQSIRAREAGIATEADNQRIKDIQNKYANTESMNHQSERVQKVARQMNQQRIMEQAKEYGISDKTAATIAKVANRSNTAVRFADPQTESALMKDGVAVSGVKTANGDIIINAKAGDPVESTFVHELTHETEGTGSYDKYAEFVTDLADNGEIDYRQDVVNSVMADDSYSAEEKQNEKVAYITEDILGNESALERLSEDQSAFKYLVDRIKAYGDSATTNMLKAVKKYDSAITADHYRLGGVNQYKLKKGQVIELNDGRTATIINDVKDDPSSPIKVKYSDGKTDTLKDLQAKSFRIKYDKDDSNVKEMQNKIIQSDAEIGRTYKNTEETAVEKKPEAIKSENGKVNIPLYPDGENDRVKASRWRDKYGWFTDDNHVPYSYVETEKGLAEVTAISSDKKTLTARLVVPDGNIKSVELTRDSKISPVSEEDFKTRSATAIAEETARKEAEVQANKEREAAEREKASHIYFDEPNAKSTLYNSYKNVKTMDSDTFIDKVGGRAEDANEVLTDIANNYIESLNSGDGTKLNKYIDDAIDVDGDVDFIKSMKLWLDNNIKKKIAKGQTVDVDRLVGKFTQTDTRTDKQYKEISDIVDTLNRVASEYNAETGDNVVDSPEAFYDPHVIEPLEYENGDKDESVLLVGSTKEGYYVVNEIKEKYSPKDVSILPYEEYDAMGGRQFEEEETPKKTTKKKIKSEQEQFDESVKKASVPKETAEQEAFDTTVMSDGSKLTAEDDKAIVSLTNALIKDGALDDLSQKELEDVVKNVTKYTAEAEERWYNNLSPEEKAEVDQRRADADEREKYYESDAYKEELKRDQELWDEAKKIAERNNDGEASDAITNIQNVLDNNLPGFDELKDFEEAVTKPADATTTSNDSSNEQKEPSSRAEDVANNLWINTVESPDIIRNAPSRGINYPGYQRIMNETDARVSALEESLNANTTQEEQKAETVEETAKEETYNLDDVSENLDNYVEDNIDDLGDADAETLTALKELHEQYKKAADARVEELKADYTERNGHEPEKDTVDAWRSNLYEGNRAVSKFEEDSFGDDDINLAYRDFETYLDKKIKEKSTDVTPKKAVQQTKQEQEQSTFEQTVSKTKQEEKKTTSKKEETVTKKEEKKNTKKESKQTAKKEKQQRKKEVKEAIKNGDTNTAVTKTVEQRISDIESFITEGEIVNNSEEVVGKQVVDKDGNTAEIVNVDPAKKEVEIKTPEGTKTVSVDDIKEITDPGINAEAVQQAEAEAKADVIEDIEKTIKAAEEEAKTESSEKEDEESEFDKLNRNDTRNPDKKREHNHYKTLLDEINEFKGSKYYAHQNSEYNTISNQTIDDKVSSFLENKSIDDLSKLFTDERLDKDTSITSPEILELSDRVLHIASDKMMEIANKNGYKSYYSKGFRNFRDTMSVNEQMEFSKAERLYENSNKVFLRSAENAGRTTQKMRDYKKNMTPEQTSNLELEALKRWIEKFNHAKNNVRIQRNIENITKDFEAEYYDAIGDRARQAELLEQLGEERGLTMDPTWGEFINAVRYGNMLDSIPTLLRNDAGNLGKFGLVRMKNSIRYFAEKAFLQKHYYKPVTLENTPENNRITKWVANNSIKQINTSYTRGMSKATIKEKGFTGGLAKLLKSYKGSEVILNEYVQQRMDNFLAQEIVKNEYQIQRVKVDRRYVNKIVDSNGVVVPETKVNAMVSAAYDNAMQYWVTQSDITSKVTEKNGKVSFDAVSVDLRGKHKDIKGFTDMFTDLVFLGEFKTTDKYGAKMMADAATAEGDGSWTINQFKGGLFEGKRNFKGRDIPILGKGLQAIEGVNRFVAHTMDNRDAFWSSITFKNEMTKRLVANGYTCTKDSGGNYTLFDSEGNKIDPFNDETLQKIYELAREEAKEAVFREDNMWAKEVTNFRNKLLDRNDALGNISAGTLDAFVAFTTTPFNIARDAVVNYSPVALFNARADYNKLATGEVTPRTYINNITRGLSGTGLWALGAYLFARGIIEPSDDDDDDLATLKRDTGYQSYALKWERNGETYYMDITPGAPGTVGLLAGADGYRALMKKAEDGGFVGLAAAEAVGSAFLSSLKPAMSITAFSSVDDVMSDFQYGGYSGMAKGLAESYANQVFGWSYGTHINNAARALMGKNAVTTYSGDNSLARFGKNIANKVPGLPFLLDSGDNPFITEDLTVKGETTPKDKWGNPLMSAAGELFGIAKITKDTSDKYDKELMRLYRATGDYSTLPSDISSVKIDGQKYKFTANERRDLQERYGKMYVEERNNYMDSPQYELATDEEKAKMLSKIQWHCYNEVTKDYSDINDLGYELSDTDKAADLLKTANIDLPTFYQIKNLDYVYDENGDKVESSQAMKARQVYMANGAFEQVYDFIANGDTTQGMCELSGTVLKMTDDEYALAFSYLEDGDIEAYLEVLKDAKKRIRKEKGTSTSNKKSSGSSSGSSRSSSKSSSSKSSIASNQDLFERVMKGSESKSRVKSASSGINTSLYDQIVAQHNKNLNSIKNL